MTTSYCYDAADKLVSSTDPRYGTIAYDVRGNTTALGPQTLAYDGADRHVSTAIGRSDIRYVRDATDRIVRREASSGYTSVVRYGNSGDGDTADFTLDADNNLIERTIGLLGGVLLTKRGTGDTWSYPNVHGDVMATADATGQAGAHPLLRPLRSGPRGPARQLGGEVRLRLAGPPPAGDRRYIRSSLWCGGCPCNRFER